MIRGCNHLAAHSASVGFGPSYAATVSQNERILLANPGAERRAHIEQALNHDQLLIDGCERMPGKDALAYAISPISRRRRVVDRPGVRALRGQRDPDAAGDGHLQCPAVPSPAPRPSCTRLQEPSMDARLPRPADVSYARCCRGRPGAYCPAAACPRVVQGWSRASRWRPKQLTSTGKRAGSRSTRRSQGRRVGTRLRAIRRRHMCCATGAACSRKRRTG
jgi:hypothetical protein